MGQRRRIAGLRILITGASQGIGRALALEAARRGALVLAAARSEALLAELAREAQAAGHPLHTVRADVTAPAERQKMADEAVRLLRRTGRTDQQCRYRRAPGHFAEASPDRLRSIMEVNFFGVTETTRVCLPLLKQGVTPAVAEHFVHRRPSRDSCPERLLGEQVRRAGLQRGAAGGGGEGRH